MRHHRALVTGGAGFIGSHLVRGLLEQGLKVRVFDNFATGHRHNLAAVESHIEIHEGDLRDADACAKACQQIEVVFHLGALGSVPRSIEDPRTTNAVNMEGTLNLLLAARDAGAQRLIFSSSSSVYGNAAVLPTHEALPLNPRSPYAASKMAGEAYCKAFARAYGLETVCLRYFNVFGPRQDPNSQYAAVIPRFLLALHEGRAPLLYDDGQQSRDFTYVDNVVAANLLAADAPDVAGEVFNIACGNPVTVHHVLQEIASLLSLPCNPQYLPPRIGDIRHSCAAIDAARERLGYQPRVSFAEGIARTVEAYQQALRSRPLPALVGA